MFINQNFIAIVFKFINFFAIIALGFFIFKKYFKADVLASIEQKQTDHDDIVAQHLMLENKQRDLNLTMKEEAIQCNNFRSKIDEWKKVISSEQDKQEKEFNDLSLIIKERKIAVATKKEEQRVQQSVTKTIVVDLEKSLTHDFKNSQRGAEYLDVILRFMNEKIS